LVQLDFEHLDQGLNLVLSGGQPCVNLADLDVSVRANSC
jgi:hypothetical protein